LETVRRKTRTNVEVFVANMRTIGRYQRIHCGESMRPNVMKR
jgi:hypothetical protein